MEKYFEQVKKFPLLSSEQEHELMLAKCSGSELAKEKIINSNLRLVIKIAKNYSHCNIPLLDLIQEGNIGLIRAVTRFDPSLGCKLSTYASYWIRQNIERYVLGKGKEIKIPIRQHMLFKKIKPLINVIPIDEVSEIFNVSADLICDLSKSFKEFADIDNPEESFFIEDKVNTGPENECFETELREKINTAVNSLFDTEKEVIKDRFIRGKTLRTISKETGFSIETVRKIELRVLEKLRNNFPELQEYIA